MNYKCTLGKKYLRFKNDSPDVPEVLNVHVNENKKKSTFSRRIFFSSSEKLTFEKENVILFNTFVNFHLFYSIVVNFL